MMTISITDDQSSDSFPSMPSDPSLTDRPGVLPVLAERIGYLFAKLHHRWVNASVSALGDAGLGLSALHFGSLAVLASAGPMSQQSLGDFIGKDRTTMVAIVDELEQEGLVERRRNPADRRAYALEVTGSGHRWLEQAGPLLGSCEDRMLATLDASEREQLLGLLQRVLAAPD